MLRNYLVVAWRSLWRYRGHSLVNILGLAIGIACCVLTGLYVEHELSFDRQFGDGNRIYRVLRELHAKGNSREFAPFTSGALAQAMEDEIPEVESAIRFRTADSWLKVEGDAVESTFALADPDVLSFFEIQMLEGDPDSALSKPWSLVLTESMAGRLFGSRGPIGQTVTVETPYFLGDYTVTGIIPDLERSSVRCSALTGLVDAKPFNRLYADRWRPLAWRPYITYFKLRDQGDAELVEERLEAVMARHMGKETLAGGRYHIQPLTEVHLYTRRDFGIAEGSHATGDIERVHLFATAALFVLLVACVNFTNLATARAQTRVQEIGLRKVVGASRVQLIRQFLSESLVTTFLALVVGLLLATVALPYVNAYLGRELEMVSLLAPRAWMGLLLLGGVVGLVAGGYPAFYLSSRGPVDTLKGSDGGRTRSTLRQVLVVFQFAVSIILVAATLVARQQLQYVESRPLGFERDLLITMPIFEMARHTKQYRGNVFLARDYGTVKQAFLDHPGVLMASASRRTMGVRGHGSPRNVYGEGQIDRPFRMLIHSSDADFLKVYQIPLLAGRTYSSTALSGGEPYSDLVHDQPYSDVVINRTAARQFGWEDPVGRHFVWIQGARRKISCQIVGVMEDFHSASLREPIQPLAINLVPSVFSLLTVRISSKGVPEALSFLEETWKRFLPDRPFTYSFVDENLAELYQEDRRFGASLSVFSALAIAISCLGLLGLTASLVRSRTKEIGIRKALGASEGSIWRLLTGQVTRGILIASIAALPIAYSLMEHWLMGFAYRASQGPVSYLVSILATFALALLVVSAHTISAARANPVDALRDE